MKNGLTSEDDLLRTISKMSTARYLYANISLYSLTIDIHKVHKAPFLQSVEAGRLPAIC
jgi:hypothetical protein